MPFIMDAHTLVDPCPPALQPRTRRALWALHSHCTPSMSTAPHILSREYDSTHGTVMVILQHAAVAYPAMMGPLASRPQHPRPRYPPHRADRHSVLTSGRITPHRLHLDTAARVTCTSWLQRTPVSALCFADRRFLAHKIPLRACGSRGGSSANPGGIVQT